MTSPERQGGGVARPVCSICGTVPEPGGVNCCTAEEALAPTPLHPDGCPWLDSRDRAALRARARPTDGAGR